MMGGGGAVRPYAEKRPTAAQETEEEGDLWGCYNAIMIMCLCYAACFCKSKRSRVFGARAHSAAWRGATAHAARARLRERVQMGPLRRGAELAV